MENKEFYRRTIKVGNSAGVLLPKTLLGAEVKVTITHLPINIKKDISSILENWFEEIAGIYVIKAEKMKIESLVISTSLKKHIETGNYLIDIVPLEMLKRSIKTNPSVRNKIASAKTILNKKILFELRKEFSIKPLPNT
jgi:hypothetical protein